MSSHLSERSAVQDQDLLMALMDSTPDKIYFKDRESRFIRINRAHVGFFNLKHPDEAVGKTDYDFFSTEHAQDAREDELHILETGEPIVGKTEKETHPDGHITWVSTTKMPLLDRNGQIIGTFGISRDVTDKHLTDEKLARYARELAQKNAQMEKDLHTAREVQEAFLPEKYPVLPRNAAPAESAIRLCHRYLPTAEVGGDFFHVAALSDTTAMILICDVMGHGVSAALITAVQRTLVEELTPLAHNPGVFVTELNRRLRSVFKRFQATMFVSAFHLIIDLAAGVARFANAGHPRPLHIRRSTGEVMPLKSPTGETGTALGVFDCSVYQTQEVSLMPDDFLMLFTDGLCDVDGPTGEDYFDEARLVAAIRKHTDLRGEKLLDALLDEIRSFAGPEPFMDDVCMVGVDVERLLG